MLGPRRLTFFGRDGFGWHEPSWFKLLDAGRRQIFRDLEPSSQSGISGPRPGSPRAAARGSPRSSSARPATRPISAGRGVAERPSGRRLDRRCGARPAPATRWTAPSVRSLTLQVGLASTGAPDLVRLIPNSNPARSRRARARGGGLRNAPVYLQQYSAPAHVRWSARRRRAGGGPGTRPGLGPSRAWTRWPFPATFRPASPCLDPASDRPDRRAAGNDYSPHRRGRSRRRRAAR